MYTPFLSDEINDMDHMRISGTEPSIREIKSENKVSKAKVKSCKKCEFYTGWSQILLNEIP